MELKSNNNLANLKGRVTVLLKRLVLPNLTILTEFNSTMMESSTWLVALAG
jgi:hypothetical protein